jgi:hypothetical protein
MQMKTGIAIYLGLDNTFEENIQLIETAAKYGVQRIFTSLHIPETDKNSLKKQISEVLNVAKKNNMEVISDISPATLEILGIEKFSLSCRTNHQV